jgi:hypothetical protein
MKNCSLVTNQDISTSTFLVVLEKIFAVLNFSQAQEVHWGSQAKQAPSHGVNSAIYLHSVEVGSRGAAIHFGW